MLKILNDSDFVATIQHILFLTKNESRFRDSVTINEIK